MKNLILLFIAAMIISGCAVISRGTLKEVDKDITVEMVQSKPDLYVGKKVVWGGTVLGTENRERASEIEVLESELAFDYTPKDGVSKGRFIIESPRFLDSNVYKANKRITVAGTVKGVETRKIGKMDYNYPVVTPIEMKLFEPPAPQPSLQEMYPYGVYGPYGPYGPPYGPYGPFNPYPWPPNRPYPPAPYPYPYYPYPY